MKKKLIFVITQFYKGGAEVALLNLFQTLNPKEYEVDFLIFDQIPLKHSTSLVPLLPNWVRVCNAAEKEGKLAFFLKIFFKGCQKLTKHQLYRPSALRFVKGKNYDAAFSYGEWISPEFIVKKVAAKKKFIWIHTDIDKAEYVDEKILFGYDKHITSYIFVSETSRQSAESRFIQLKGKSTVIHNICNDTLIRRQAQEKAVEMLGKKPWLVTVGNLRKEKNCRRHIEVMRELKARGIHVTWFWIGAAPNTIYYSQLKELVQQYQLSDCFLFLGAKENPYPYMAKADAVVLLSDYESWSLVITEAKLLGIPVIATRTSGAVEQIKDRETGILTSFDVKEEADQITEYILSDILKKNIKKKLIGFSTGTDSLNELNVLIGEQKIEKTAVSVR